MKDLGVGICIIGSIIAILFVSLQENKIFNAVFSVLGFFG